MVVLADPLAMAAIAIIAMLVGVVYWSFTGIMKNNIETTVIVDWGYIGMMENQMETAIVCWGYIGIVQAVSKTCPSM